MTKEERAEYMREYRKLPHAHAKELERKAAYRAARKEELAKKQSERYYSNHEEELAKRRLKRETNREAFNVYNREYQRKWRERNREKLRDYMRDYTSKPDQRLKQRNVKGRRRAKEKASAIGPISYLKLKIEFDGICKLCSKPLNLASEKFHFDHIVPISQGGSHTQDNLHITNASCNLKKNRYCFIGLRML